MVSSYFDNEIRHLFAAVKDLDSEYYYFSLIQQSTVEISMALNKCHEFCIYIPDSIECMPLVLGRLSVSAKILESCNHASPIVLKGFFLSLQTDSVREAAALVSLAYSYLMNPDSSSFTDWLKRVAELFRIDKVVNSIGLAGELLFLHRSCSLCPDIIRCWNPVGYSPFDFSPPPGLKISAYRSYFEVKSSNLDSHRYLLKTSQLMHQLSISNSFTYVFSGIAVSANGVTLPEFCYQIYNSFARQASFDIELKQILYSKIELLTAWLSMFASDFRFDPLESSMCLVIEKNIPFPEQLHPAISVEKYYLTSTMVSSEPLEYFFNSN
jgi:hypothetical protein